MKLKELTISNFKCFKSEQTFKFGKITLLLGENSSGKSSIMQAIWAPLQSGEFPFTFSPNGDLMNLGSFKDIVWGHDTDREIRIKMEFEDHSLEKLSTSLHNHDTYWIENKHNQQPELNTIEGIYDIITNDPDANSYPAFYLQAKNINGQIKIIKISSSLEDAKFSNPEYAKPIKELHTKYPQLAYNINLDTASLKNHENKAKFETIILFWNTFAYQTISTYLSSYRLPPERTYQETTKRYLKVGTFGEGYLDQILRWQTENDTRYIKLIETMQGLGLLQNINARRMDGGRYEFQIQTKNNNVNASISDVGFGISQIMPVLVADLQLSGDSTLYVQEPETHLHPSVQAAYGAHLVERATNTNKTYVIETHSEYLINSLRLAIVKGEIAPEDVQVYFTENTGDDTTVHDVKFTKQGTIEQAPDNFFRTYMMGVLDIALNAEAE